MVRWEDGCRPKGVGGLGIGCLKEKNFALLAKWLWRFLGDRGSLWHSTILNKYGMHSNEWDVNPWISTSMSLTWAYIISLFPLFLHFVRFLVGSGNSISFWKDFWSGDQCLSPIFPRLFRLAIHKDVKVLESMSSSPQGNSWTIQL